jgi:hypothetical protein
MRQKPMQKHYQTTVTDSYRMWKTREHMRMQSGELVANNIAGKRGKRSGKRNTAGAVDARGLSGTRARVDKSMEAVKRQAGKC